jgi:mono/diheme cytochrome c family protein
VELLLVGAAALAFALWTAPRRRRLLRTAVPIGVAAIIGGSFVAGSGAAALSQTVRNPIPPTQESVQRGGQIYAERCAICHGDDGRGDGPAGLALRPPPADFRVHMAAGHTDAQLFDWIKNGFPGSAMPAFRDQLSPEDRWNVLNYIQLSFGPGRTPPTPQPTTVTS